MLRTFLQPPLPPVFLPCQEVITSCVLCTTGISVVALLTPLLVRFPDEKEIQLRKGRTLCSYSCWRSFLFSFLFYFFVSPF
ncbi:hypothetical protein BKA57DRAFT_475155 [Linnemannia elongata]|nr:hypothetical protein BKA57DRAFT_475155 [Linnemannia elongata]